MKQEKVWSTFPNSSSAQLESVPKVCRKTCLHFTAKKAQVE